MTGTLFSAWQATTQAEQPVQASRSIDIPQLCSPCRRSFQRLGSASLVASLAAFARPSLGLLASDISRTIGRPSIEKWVCARASVSRRPVLASVTVAGPVAARAAHQPAPADRR